MGRARLSLKLLLKRLSKLAAAAVRVPLPALPSGFSISHTLSRAGRFTLIAVLSLLIHRLRKSALYSLQVTDTLKGFAEITTQKHLTKSMVLWLRNPHRYEAVAVTGNFPSISHEAAKGGKKLIREKMNAWGENSATEECGSLWTICALLRGGWGVLVPAERRTSTRLNTTNAFADAC